MKPILFALPGNERLAQRLAQELDWELGSATIRRFPDGESYVRLLSEVQGREVIFAGSLDRPDEKFMTLYIAASLAREQGARRIGLVAPYLAYMRQDSAFNKGEGQTSVQFGKLLSSFIDWIVTVDPHLHRHHDLAECYSIPTRIVRAAPAIADWLKQNIQRPLIIGPDAESEQWAGEVARLAGAPCIVLEKIRRGDRDVSVSVPDTDKWRDHTPVLVDDIASTARTMMSAASHILNAGLAKPVCIAVHAVFADNAHAELRDMGVGEIVSCNTITHASNRIDLLPALAPVVAAMIN
ncbi:ribose-phosphate pyrophosphokinase [Pseudoduganella sp. RAF53_2]|uniref:ribose-phosphate pyrophosphokinase n=1 Tax=unclassified Pseudoduganella TaxID=2637179 RepID=UPI003F9AFE92